MLSLLRNLSCLLLRNQKVPLDPCWDTQESSESLLVLVFRVLELMEECCRNNTIESKESVWLGDFLSKTSFSNLSSLFHMTCFSFTDGSLFFCLPLNLVRSGEEKKLSMLTSVGDGDYCGDCVMF